MESVTHKKKNFGVWIIIGLVGFCFCGLVGLIILRNVASSSPSVQATGTARIESKVASTRIAAETATNAAMQTENTIPTATKLPSLTVTITATNTVDPSITPPTPTSTSTATLTSTATATAKATATATKTSTSTQTPIPSKTPTVTSTPTTIPDNAGVTDWLVYEGKRIGVREIIFNNYLGYYRPDSGKIFVSLYIIAINESTSETSFFGNDLHLVDGGGEITHGVLLADKSPDFSTCTLKPGGSCEGWWTTMIWNRPEVRDNLFFRWDPCLLFCSAMETPIYQNK